MINIKNIRGETVYTISSDIARDVSTALKFTMENKRWFATVSAFRMDIANNVEECDQLNAISKEKLTDDQKLKIRSMSKVLLEMEDTKYKIQEEMLEILSLKDIAEQLTFDDIDNIFKLVVEKEQANQAPKTLGV